MPGSRRARPMLGQCCANVGDNMEPSLAPRVGLFTAKLRVTININFAWDNNRSAPGGTAIGRSATQIQEKVTAIFQGSSYYRLVLQSSYARYRHHCQEQTDWHIFLARRWFRARFCCPSQRNRCDKETRKKRWCWQSILAVNNYCKTVVCKVISFKTYLKLISVSETIFIYTPTTSMGRAIFEKPCPCYNPCYPSSMQRALTGTLCRHDGDWRMSYMCRASPSWKHKNW